MAGSTGGVRAPARDAGAANDGRIAALERDLRDARDEIAELRESNARMEEAMRHLWSKVGRMAEQQRRQSSAAAAPPEVPGARSSTDELGAS